MKNSIYQKAILTFMILFAAALISGQKLLKNKLPDTGQTSSYTSLKGEDSDYFINPSSYKDNGDGTITDYITGLMWQKVDGGEMIFENAVNYCNNLTLGGYSGWRLPTSHELFNINQFDNVNPALNTNYFTKTAAEYWWTSETRVDDASRVWVVNAGGGVGAHPKSETQSAGGSKLFHVRAVRDLYSTTFSLTHFTDNEDGTITDNYTGLVWQKIQSKNTYTWEEALNYAGSFSLAGKTDWRIPNIKELFSLNEETLAKPSFNNTYFPNVSSGNFWSSTSLVQNSIKAWDINVDYGIVSYNDKATKQNVLLVRGGNDNEYLGIDEVQINGGEFLMGDQFGFVDPSHPSDELPVHKVKVNSFKMGKHETTNEQFIAFLNSSLLSGNIIVKDKAVYSSDGTTIYCFTFQNADYYSISYDGKNFAISDFRSNHPMVGVMWKGAVAFCNWLSEINGLQSCYNLETSVCDFNKNGYRLPTEAEWEFAGRGGKLNPYFIYPNGNTIDTKSVNLPNSGDPYEVAAYPNTTPVGFYDGQLHFKTDYNWPGNAVSYQTSDGANGFGLYDMQGNVWEFVNDWYGQNYYSLSPYDNPKGPDTGFLMPDGKPYRGMRGGNWYNGLVTNGVNDGHSRVANRNPSYYRGPQDPNHPYYHLGFRTVRNYVATSIQEEPAKESIPVEIQLYQNYPNPFNPSTVISYRLSKGAYVKLNVYDILGREIATLVNEYQNPGVYHSQFSITNVLDRQIIDNGLSSGIYFYTLRINEQSISKKMVLIK